MKNTRLGRREFLTGSLAAASMPSLSAPVIGGQSSPGKRLLAGAATANITPALGCSVAGLTADRIATEVHDELHVRSLALDNGITRLALAVVDSCMVPGDLIGRAKQRIQERTGIPVANIMVSASHSHSAPPAVHLFQSLPDPQYLEFLTNRIADGVQMAVNRLEPARVGWGVGREEKILFTRRFYMKPGTMAPNPFGRRDERVKMNPGIQDPNIVRPEGPVDPDVSVLVVESAGGRPISVFTSYGLHYIGGAGPGHLSADYFAVYADSIARLAGVPGKQSYPPFVGIMANGCSGASVSIDRFRPMPKYAPYEKMQLVADMLAAETLRTWRTMDFHDWVELGASQEEIDLGVRLPGAADVAEARRILANAGPGQLREGRLVYARETVLLAEGYPSRVKTPIQALRIGSLGIATFPGEAFAELGLEVKAKSPFKPTMMIELANDYRGYIPTVEAHRNGGYETWRAKSSYLEVEAAPKMVSAALRRLQALAG